MSSAAATAGTPTPTDLDREEGRFNKGGFLLGIGFKATRPRRPRRPHRPRQWTRGRVGRCGLYHGGYYETRGVILCDSRSLLP